MQVHGKRTRPQTPRFANATALARRGLPVPLPPLRLALFGLLALAGLLVTLFQFTRPAVQALAAIFPHLAHLWTISGNRGPIVWLAVRAVAPLLWLVMVALVYWLWLGVTDLFHEEAQIPAVNRGHALGVTAPAPLRPSPPAPDSPPHKRLHTSSQLAARRHTRHLLGRHQLRHASHPLATLPAITAEQPAPQASPLEPAALSHGAGTAHELASPPVYVQIRLLGEVSVVVRNPHTGQEAKIPMQASHKRRELLAYFAWQRDKTILRDAILHDVFERGLSEDDGDGIDEAQKVKSNFASQVKFLRQDINAVAATFGLPRLNVVDHAREWWLAPYCRVIDLDLIEEQYRIIEAAIRDNTVETTDVRDACDRLIAAYRWDFLEKHVKNREYEPWHQCWVRAPFTTFRDYYLTALWIRAEYEAVAGEKVVGNDEQERMRQQRACFARAGYFYEKYALHAPNTRFDLKVYGREPGERIRTSERALRRGLEMYSLSLNIQAVDALFENYKKVMRTVFPAGLPWKPSPETEEVLAEARAQTRTHRLQGRILSPDAYGEDAEKHDL